MLMMSMAVVTMLLMMRMTLLMMVVMVMMVMMIIMVMTETMITMMKGGLWKDGAGRNKAYTATRSVEDDVMVMM